MQESGACRKKPAMPSRNAGSHLVVMKRIQRNGDGAMKRQKHGRRELREVKRTLRRLAKSEDFSGAEDENNGENKGALTILEWPIMHY